MREAVRKTVPAQIKTHFSFRSCAKRETVLGLQREKRANASISVRVGPCTRGYPGFLLSHTNRMASRIVVRGKARCRSRRCLLPRQRQAKRLRAELVLPVYSTIVPRYTKSFDSRGNKFIGCTIAPAFSALFFWPGRGPSSFRQDEKKMGGALRRCRLANRSLVLPLSGAARQLSPEG